jgi:hypothetical protein
MCCARRTARGQCGQWAAKTLMVTFGQPARRLGFVLELRFAGGDGNDGADQVENSARRGAQEADVVRGASTATAG